MIDYSDQTGIFDPSKFGYPVHLIGLGGIGSALVHPLVKLGVPMLHLWDYDPEIEPHNIPAQCIYRPSDVGDSKITAAANFLFRQEAANTCSVTYHDEAVSESTPLTGVVISGVDSMKSRRAIWEAVAWNPEVPLYLDGRIGGEELQLLACNPCDPDEVEWYGGELFDDEAMAELPCAERTVIHPPIVLSGLIVAQITAFARGRTPKRDLRMHLGSMQFLSS